MESLEKAAQDLEEYAKLNGSTAERGIEKDDGSIVVIRSVQGNTATVKHIDAADRAESGWPAPEVNE